MNRNHSEDANNIAALQKILKDYEIEVEEYKKKIKNLEQFLETKNEAFTAKINKLASENSDLKGTIELLTSQPSQMQSENDAAEEIRALKDIIAHLEVRSDNFIIYKELYEDEKTKYENEVQNRVSDASKIEAYAKEIEKLKSDIDHLTQANAELKSKVSNHLQNTGRSNPFIHSQVEIYPKINHNANDLRKYLTMADVVVKSDINYNRLKEKVLIIQNLESDPNYDYMSEQWYAENIKICLKNAMFKLFLDGELHVTKELEATTLFQHIFYCNLTTLELSEQSLSYQEFIKLVSSGTIEILKFSKVYVENKNCGKALEIDEILMGLKKLKEVEFRLTEYADTKKPPMTRETAKKLGKLERFQFLRKFEIHNLPSAFDRHAFGKFMNKHPNVTFNYSNINADEEVFLSQFEKCKRRIINRLP
uniref:Uncharacterized protein n=1 Tax=Panagrolaimus sp. PS1159 TaxID=55785 RepID=A0AC35G8W7_9BILA